MNAKLLLLGTLSLSSCFLINRQLGGGQCEPTCTDDGNVLRCDAKGDFELLPCALQEGEFCRPETLTCGVCGDSIVSTGEACDDGNQTTNDGCDNCQLEVFNCGNGVAEPGEECDDGNNVNNDGCNNSCGAPLCGNSITDQNETCDDGNTDNGDGCAEDCKIEQPAVCGNGTVEATEACDDGNTTNGDLCEGNCTEPFCGNLIKDLGEACDDGNAANDDGCSAVCQFETCGDGILQANEQCDDGNTVNNDACSNVCVVVGCGDGAIQVGEQCDDSNTANGDGCSSSCQSENCGDGILQGGEECDNGFANSDIFANACRTDCKQFSCKDGTVDFNEQCDNTTANCNAQCQIVARAEIENNDNTTDADGKAAQLPITAASRITGARNLVDIFQVNLPQTTVVRIEIFDSTGIDCVTNANPLLVLLDDSGNEIDRNDDEGIGLCGAIVTELPAGISYVQLDKSVSPNNYTYILEVMPLADLAAEVESNNTTTLADPILGKNVFAFGTHQGSADVDFYRITVPTTGLSVRAEIFEANNIERCEDLNIDSNISLLNDQGAVISFNDDIDNTFNGNFCSLIDGTGNNPKNTGAHNLPAGTYFIKVEESPLVNNITFQYRLAVTIR